MGIYGKTNSIIQELNNKLVEREDIVPMLLLAIYSKSHMLLLGPPGVGKTYLIEMISHFVKDIQYFEYLITNDTSLSELFGSKMVDENGDMSYNISHSMLDSHICFVDELYKANSTLLNSLLGVTHSSRSFYQRGRGKLKSPMISMFAASNELPENDAVIAFDDRILFRFWLDEIQNKDNLQKFVKRDFDRTQNFSKHLSLKEILSVYEDSKKIMIQDGFVEIYTEIRNKLGTEKVTISDRKLQSTLDIFQVSAFVNRRDSLNLSDLFLLINIAWKGFDDIERVERVIFEQIFGNLNNIAAVLKDNRNMFELIKSKTSMQTTRTLQYTYSFYGNGAEEEFNNTKYLITEIKKGLLKAKEGVDSLKEKYNFIKIVEDLIQKNIFLPNYKNHIFLENNIEKNIEKKVNKNEIFKLSDDITLLLNKLTFWLNDTPSLYDYNNKQL